MLTPLQHRQRRRQEAWCKYTRALAAADRRIHAALGQPKPKAVWRPLTYWEGNLVLTRMGIPFLRGTTFRPHARAKRGPGFAATTLYAKDSPSYQDAVDRDNFIDNKDALLAEAVKELDPYNAIRPYHGNGWNSVAIPEKEIQP